MSEGLNRVLFMGNVGADPELRFTRDGQAVLSLRLAATDSYLDKDKVRRERTEWMTVVVWGKRGESLAKFVKKGFCLLVEGSLRTTAYDDRDGNKRYKTEIVASNVIVTKGDAQGSSGQSQRQGYGAPRTQHAPSPPPANGPPPEDFGYDGGDDIPF